MLPYIVLAYSKFAISSSKVIIAFNLNQASHNALAGFIIVRLTINVDKFAEHLFAVNDLDAVHSASLVEAIRTLRKNIICLPDIVSAGGNLSIDANKVVSTIPLNQA